MDVLWVAFEGPQRGAAYLGMSGPHGRVMRRSFRTHRFVAGRTQGSTLAGMLRPVGAFNTQNAPIRCGLEGVYEVPIADVERLLQVAITVTDEFHVGLEDVCGA